MTPIETIETKLVVKRHDLFASDYRGNGWTNDLLIAAKWSSDLRDSAERIAGRNPPAQVIEIIKTIRYNETLEARA